MANLNPKYDLARLMPPWKPGDSGNPRGRRKGLRKMVMDVLHGNELAGQTLADGRTVIQAMLESAAAQVIQGRPTGPAYMRELIQMAGYDVTGERSADESGKVTFTIIANGRDGKPAEVEDTFTREASSEHESIVAEPKGHNCPDGLNGQDASNEREAT